VLKRKASSSLYVNGGLKTDGYEETAIQERNLWMKRLQQVVCTGTGTSSLALFILKRLKPQRMEGIG